MVAYGHSPRYCPKWSQAANTFNMDVEQQPSNILINALEERDGKDWRHVIGSVELAVRKGCCQQPMAICRTMSTINTAARKITRH